MFKSFRTWLKKPNKSTFEQYVEAIIVVVPIAFLIRTYFYGLYQVPTGSMETTMLVGERFVADKFTVWFRPIQRGDIISFNDPTFPYATNTFMNYWQRYVWGPSNWTKRVIGIPGDHVQGKVEDGKPVIYLNGTKLEEPYVNKYPLIPVWSCKPSLESGWFNRNINLIYRSVDRDVPYDKQPFYRIDPETIIPEGIAQRIGIEPIRWPGSLWSDGSDVFDVTLGADEYWAMGDNRRGSLDSRSWGPLKGQLIHGKIIFRLLSIDERDSWLVLDILKHPIDFWRRVRWSRCLNFVA